MKINYIKLCNICLNLYVSTYLCHAVLQLALELYQGFSEETLNNDASYLVEDEIQTRTTSKLVKEDFNDVAICRCGEVYVINMLTIKHYLKEL